MRSRRERPAPAFCETVLPTCTTGPLVRRGGMIAFHDIEARWASAAVYRLARRSPRVTVIVEPAALFSVAHA